MLPGLTEFLPEAKLNLVCRLPSLGVCGVLRHARRHLLQVIYHLRHDEVKEAYDLIKDLDPSIPQEYILKVREALCCVVGPSLRLGVTNIFPSSCQGVVNAVMGQTLGSREHLKIAQQFFQLVRACVHT